VLRAVDTDQIGKHIFIQLHVGGC